MIKTTDQRGFSKFLDEFFQISKRGSSIKKEIMGGLITFLSMAYILAVNPGMLSATGMPFNSVFMATALAAGISTILMGVFARLPFALAPGMGINAFFTFNVAMYGMKLGWEQALAAVLVSGILFAVISVTGLRKKALDAIPTSMKYAIGSGIGMFIAFIGLKNSNIIAGDSATIVAIGNWKDAGTLLALFGITLMIILYFAKVKAFMIISMITTLVIGLVLTKLNPNLMTSIDGGFGLPTWPKNENIFSTGDWGSLGDVAGVAFKNIGKILSSASGWIAIIVFLFVDFFDTSGTVVALGHEAKLEDSNGEIINSDKALLVDSIATIGGAALGTSTVTTFVESGTGIAAGARTGLASVITGLLFLIAIFIMPVFGMFTSAVTTLALFGVGMQMIGQLKLIDWEDKVSSVTAFFVITFMLLTFAIYWGIVLGFIVYIIAKTATGKAKEISVPLWIMGAASVAFILVEFILIK